jgi:hypothetical protein
MSKPARGFRPTKLSGTSLYPKRARALDHIILHRIIDKSFALWIIFNISNCWQIKKISVKSAAALLDTVVAPPNSFGGGSALKSSFPNEFGKATHVAQCGYRHFLVDKNRLSGYI